MKVVSTNVGQPREFHFQGQTIRSSMHREPVLTGIDVHLSHVEGDKFDNDKVHGIPEVAVYALSSDFYRDFARKIDREVAPGIFGENLTMDKLDESGFMLGDEYEVGTCRLKVTAPRTPCTKLNFSFQSPEAQKAFADFARPGVYFEVLTSGRIQPGDELKLVKANGASYSIADAFELWRLSREISTGRIQIDDVREQFRRFVDDERVPSFLRTRFRKIAEAPSSHKS